MGLKVNWRYSGLVVLVLILAGNLAGWWVMNRPVEPRPWGQMINGVSFSPYQANQNPQENRHPTAQQIDRDLSLLVGKVRHVRSYSATDGIEDVAPLARRYGLIVTAGAWIDGRRDRNEREIANVIAMAKANPETVRRVLVGNETLLRTDVPTEDLVAYIRRVRAAVSVPVSTAEPWHVWLKNPELAREVDFIAIHILPYWEKIPADQSIDYVMQRYQQVKDAFPTKQVVITEVGWPSDGRMRGASSPTPAAQASFLREFLNLANTRGLDYFIMEAFDQPWKRDIEGSVGAYWGVYNADRQPKFPMEGAVHDLPNWRELAIASALLALFPLAWFLARWSRMHLAGRLFYGALIQGVTTVLVYVGYTGMSQYMTAGTALMWSMLLPMLIMLLIMLLAEALEMSEVLWSKQQRHFVPFNPDPHRRWPKVSIHVPLYNEPPDMVKQTLDALDRLDYPNVEFIIVDNNTKDEAVWRPVEAYCAKLGPKFRFFHVSPLKGFKAGALNFALRQMAPDAEIVGVIDSDYLVTPDWLNSLVPYFDKPEVGFVQAPQDHRDWRGDAFKEMINWEYAGFFHIGMVQRNEHDAIIQHGTMTLIRKQAMDRVGNWAEWCICEDAEMGLRLMIGDWESVYLNRRFGYGLTPDSFTGYKSQRFRWAYGAMQILKHHWRELLPGSKTLSPMQRYHFVTGWMPWIADAVGLIFAVASIFWSAGVLVLPRYFEFPLTLFLVPVLGVFIAKILQFLWLYRVRVDCTLGQRLGAGLAGLALTYTIAKATLYGIFTSKLPFIRTPKLENTPALMQAFAMAKEETILAALLWLSGVAVWNVYGSDDPEARLWAVVMFVQSGPFVASLMLALVNSLPRLRRLSLGGTKAAVVAGE